jgi:hypothetical protein
VADNTIIPAADKPMDRLGLVLMGKEHLWRSLVDAAEDCPVPATGSYPTGFPRAGQAFGHSGRLRGTQVDLADELRQRPVEVPPSLP